MPHHLRAAVALGIAAATCTPAFPATTFGTPDASFPAVQPQYQPCLETTAATPDGSVYVVAEVPNGTDYEILRYRTDGVLDESWGAHGIAVLPSPGSGLLALFPDVLLPLPGGKLLVVGASIERLNADGSIDQTYGNFGSTDLVDPGHGGASVAAAVLQPDGSVVVQTPIYSGDPGAQFTRFDANGRRDLSIGLQGVLTVPFATTDAMYAWSLLADGTLEYGTYAPGTIGPIQPKLYRVAAFGHPSDLSIFPAQRLIPRDGMARWIEPTVSVTADGGVLFATTSCSDSTCSNPAIAVSRFTPDGAQDASFGVGSRLPVYPLASPNSFSIILVGPAMLAPLPSGELTLLIHVNASSGGWFPTNHESGIQAYRVTANGSLDASFPNGTWIRPGQYTQLADGKLMLSPSGVSGQCVTKLATDAPAVAATLVEYYNPQLDHYFVTAEGLEAGILDDNVATMGWVRTGYRFGGWLPFDVPDAVPVCRFYGDLRAGPNSHFYTPQGSECDGLRQLEAQSPLGTRAWRLEGYTFGVALAANNQCPMNLTPVYRVYNRGFERGVDPNHRYMTDASLYDQMQLKGWVGEGVRFCVPPLSSTVTR